MLSPDTHGDDAAIAPLVSELDSMGSNWGDPTAGPQPPSTSSPHIENLPAELRDIILAHMPNLPTLRSLVRASPTMHAQYRANRDALLRTCLARELDGCFIDAYACLKSRAREMRPVRTNATITLFLNNHRAWLSGPNASRPNLDSLDSSSCRWLAATHVSVVRPLARQYATWALANLARASEALADGGQQPGGPRERAGVKPGAETAQCQQQPLLSKSEEIRLFRALYRYETFCHLFGHNETPRRGGFSDDEINGIFMCLFEPWEAEALGCIDLFIRVKYKSIFEEVKWDLSDENPKFLQSNGILDPEGTFDLDGLFDDYVDGTVSRGIKITVKLLAISNHETLVNAVQKYLITRQDADKPLTHVLWSPIQRERRETSDTPNARDEAERRRDAMPFLGDTNPNGPPLGWVMLWGGVYANIYGEYTPGSIKDWGYVMWDEFRWTELGSKDLVLKQWETEPNLADGIEQDYGWHPLTR